MGTEPMVAERGEASVRPGQGETVSTLTLNPSTRARAQQARSWLQGKTDRWGIRRDWQGRDIEAPDLSGLNLPEISALVDELGFSADQNEVRAAIASLRASLQDEGRSKPVADLHYRQFAQDLLSVMVPPDLLADACRIWRLSGTEFMPRTAGALIAPVRAEMGERAAVRCLLADLARYAREQNNG